MGKKKGPHPHPKFEELAVLWVPADETIPTEIKVIENDWRPMTKLVGGYIEVVPQQLIRVTPEMVMDCLCLVSMVVNEDGLYTELEPNRRATKLVEPPQVIAGDVFLAMTGPVKDSSTSEFFSMLASDREFIEALKRHVDA